MSGVVVFEDEQAAHRRATLLAIVLTIAGYACYNVTDAVIKLLAQKYTVAQLMVVSGAMVISMTCISGAIRHGRAAFRMKNPKWIACRALFAVASGVCNLVSLPRVSLTTFYTLIFTSPFWVALLSMFFLREKITTRQAVIIVAGFGVIAWIMRPGGDIFGIWSFVLLIGAFFYSCTVVIMRYLGTQESRTMIITAGSTMGLMIGLPFALTQPFPDTTLADVSLFATLGAFGAVAPLMLAHAFQTAPSTAVIVPFHYTQIIWGALLGYFIFGEIPGRDTITGAALLIMGGLALVWSESRRLKG